MDCKTARMLLEFHRPAELDEQETDALGSHLHDCRPCAQTARREREADEHLGRAMKDVPVPADLSARIVKRLAGQDRNWFRRHARALAAAAAVLLVAGLGMGYWLRPRPAVDVTELADNVVLPESSVDQVEDWFFTTYKVKTSLPRFMKYNHFVTASRAEFLSTGKLVPRLLFVRKQDKQDFAEVWVLRADQFNLKASLSKPTTQAGSGRTTILLMPDREGRDDVAYLIIYSGGSLDWLLTPEALPF